jgi:tetratricopeptide (TPR) repeat protein
MAHWLKNLFASRSTVENQTIYADNVQFADTINNFRGIPPEEFKALSKELGVTQTALENFFKILKQQNIPYQDYDHTLHQIAERHLNLLAELAQFQSEDPEVTALLKQAEQAVEQGDYDNAEILINQAKDKDLLAAKKMQEHVNKRFLSAAENAARNGDLKVTQIKYAEAAAYFQEASKIVPVEFAEELAYYLNNAGYAWCNAGKYPEAVPLYQRSLAILEKTLGEYHPLVASSLNNLAELYNAQGNYKEAEPLYQRSLAIWEKTLGEYHPDVASSLNNLAALYHAQGNYKEAEPLYQRSLAIREKTLGEYHPDVAGSLNNLAALYDAQGNYKEAEPLYQRSLAILEKTLGENHPLVATSLNNLAVLYYAQGNYTEAEPLYNRSLAIMEKSLGANHPSTKAVRRNLERLQAAKK